MLRRTLCAVLAGVVDVSEFQAILRMLQGQAGISSYGIKRQAALQAT